MTYCIELGLGANFSSVCQLDDVDTNRRRLVVLRLLKIVKLLVGVYGVDFTTPASDGSTPLHWAAAGGHVTVIKVLLGIFCAQVCW